MLFLLCFLSSNHSNYCLLSSYYLPGTYIHLSLILSRTFKNSSFTDIKISSDRSNLWPKVTQEMSEPGFRGCFAWLQGLDFVCGILVSPSLLLPHVYSAAQIAYIQFFNFLTSVSDGADLCLKRAMSYERLNFFFKLPFQGTLPGASLWVVLYPSEDRVRGAESSDSV